MKYLLVLISIVGLNYYALAQQADSSGIVPIDPVTNLITYQEVVKEQGSKEDLFNRCVNWVNNFYANPVAVTKIRDFESGKIEGRHQFRVHDIEEGYEMDVGTILYTFIVEFREGRYRYTLTDYVLRRASRFPIENWLDKTDPAHTEQWNAYLRQVDEFSKNLIADLKEKMKPEPEEKEEEW